MSKRIAILEGQASKQFGGVKQLITELPNSGDCIWVPEDEVRLTTKRIEKNGKYYAKNEKDADKKAFYGFSSVTVAISSKTNGTKNPNPPSHSGHDGDWNYPSDGDGNDYSIDTDPNGNISEKSLPSSIKIEKNPTKMRYKNGETIVIDGAIVKAYKNDGTLWTDGGYADGVIPLSQLTVSPTKATGGGGGGGKYPWSSGAAGDMADDGKFTLGILSGNDVRVVCKDVGPQNWPTLWIDFYIFSKHTVPRFEVYIAPGEGNPWSVTEASDVRRFEIDGDMYYYVTPRVSISNAVSVAPEAIPKNTHEELEDIIKDIYDDSGGSKCEVTVTWNRPEDGRPLTDTFNVTVS